MTSEYCKLSVFFNFLNVFLKFQIFSFLSTVAECNWHVGLYRLYVCYNVLLGLAYTVYRGVRYLDGLVIVRTCTVWIA